MKHKIEKSILQNIIMPLLGILFLFVIWYIVSQTQNNVLLLPSPDTVFNYFFGLFADNSFYITIANTVIRTILCFFISLFTSILFALLSGKSIYFRKFCEPIVSLLRSAPTVAVILILYAFFTGKIMSVIVGFLISFPILYSAILSSIATIDKDILLMTKVYKLSLYQKIKSIILPKISETVFSIGGSTFSLTLKVIIASEILTNISQSIGGMIQLFYSTFEIETLLAWTLVAIVIGYILELIILLMKKCVIRWKK